MTIYAVYEPAGPAVSEPVVVADRFRWSAFVFAPIYLAAHRLWRALAGFLIVSLALILAEPVLGGGACFCLYALLAFWVGMEAPAFRSARLQRAGFAHKADLVAPSRELAQLEWLRARARS